MAVDLARLSRECGRILADKDSVMLKDSRVLKTLLATQDLHRPSRSYLFQQHGEIKPYMRKIVTSWMLEVCEEYGCEDQVFPLAVNYMDRFLTQRTISKNQLQLLGAVCLFISSKLRQCRALSLQQLVYLTDYSVTEHQIRELELVVVCRLEWELNSVTAFDFVDHLLEKLSLSEHEDMIRRHGHTFIALCATEDEFVGASAGVVAAASVTAAVHGMKLPAADRCLHVMAAGVRVPVSQLMAVVRRIEQLVQREMSSVQCAGAGDAAATSDGGGGAAAASDCASGGASVSTAASSDKLSGADMQQDSLQPDTPTDIQDVCF